MNTQKQLDETIVHSETRNEVEQKAVVSVSVSKKTFIGYPGNELVASVSVSSSVRYVIRLDVEKPT